MFLTHDEVVRITRKRQKAAQKRVLIAKGYPFETDEAGWPLVSRAYAEQRASQTEREPQRRGPDSAALAALMRRG